MLPEKFPGTPPGFTALSLSYDLLSLTVRMGCTLGEYGEGRLGPPRMSLASLSVRQLSLNSPLSCSSGIDPARSKDRCDEPGRHLQSPGAVVLIGFQCTAIFASVRAGCTLLDWGTDEQFRSLTKQTEAGFGGRSDQEPG